MLQGTCVDGYKVTGRYNYEIAELNEETRNCLAVSLSDIRIELATNVSYKAYNSLLNKLESI